MQGSDSLSILLVIHSYPPVLGGSEIEAQRVCRGLRERGHKVRVLCAANAEMPQRGEWLDPYGIPVRVMGRGGGKRLDTSFALAVAWRMWRERQDYDFVYFLMQGLHVSAGLPVARWLRKPVVMKISGSGLIPAIQSSRTGAWQLERLKRWAHRILILNDGMAEEAKAAGIPAGRLEWMPNPVDIEEFQPAADEEEKRTIRRRLSMDADIDFVLYVGRLAPEKELESLIRAMTLVEKMRLIVVGDGPSAGDLRALARALEAPVDFVGRQPMERVREYLKASDVFALVSRLEGFPCSLIEAMASGLPSVVSRIPANEQLIREGEHGLYAAVGDSEGIAKAIGRLLADRGMRETLGAAARAVVVSNYSSDRVMERYERLFRAAGADTLRRASG